LPARCRRLSRATAAPARPPVRRLPPSVRPLPLPRAAAPSARPPPPARRRPSRAAPCPQHPVAATAWWDRQMRPQLTIPGKIARGDRVAVVAPSVAAPGPFPEVHEVAMTRLREEIGLEPVEYPTTRQLGASPQARAADLMAAFADPDIKA